MEEGELPPHTHLPDALGEQFTTQTANFQLLQLLKLHGSLEDMTQLRQLQQKAIECLAKHLLVGEAPQLRQVIRCRRRWWRNSRGGTWQCRQHYLPTCIAFLIVQHPLPAKPT